MLKFGGLGEAVLARSLMEHLRSRQTGLKIDVMVDSRTREIMSCGTDTKVFSYDPQRDGLTTAARVLREVRAERYEVAVDFEQTSLLTAAFLRATGIPVRVGFAPPGDNRRARFLTHPVELRDTDSMWHGVLQLGRTLDLLLPEDSSTLPLPCRAEADRSLTEWWRENTKGCGATSRVVALHIGVGPRAEYRRWPLSRFVELAEQLRRVDPNLVVVLTGDHSDRQLIHDFKTAFTGYSIDASNLNSVEKTASLLKRCDLLVTNDTGVMHLGAAMGTPTTAVFGASNPTYWAPVGSRATFVYKTEMPCSPCIDSYRRIIPDRCLASDTRRCMLDIDVVDVLSAASEVVSGAWLDSYKLCKTEGVDPYRVLSPTIR